MEDKIGTNNTSKGCTHPIYVSFNPKNQMLDISGVCRHEAASFSIVNEKLFSFISKLGLSQGELTTLFYVVHRIIGAREEMQEEQGNEE